MKPKPYEGEETYLFVSYSHKDTDAVMPVVTELTRRGFRVWYDEGIDPGSEWAKSIADHLVGASAVIYFISPDSAESLYCRRELHYAMENKIGIMSVFLTETELPNELKLLLGANQFLHMYTYPDLGTFCDKLENSTVLSGMEKQCETGDPVIRNLQRQIAELKAAGITKEIEYTIDALYRKAMERETEQGLPPRCAVDYVRFLRSCGKNRNVVYEGNRLYNQLKDSGEKALLADLCTMMGEEYLRETEGSALDADAARMYLTKAAALYTELAAEDETRWESLKARSLGSMAELYLLENIEDPNDDVLSLCDKALAIFTRLAEHDDVYEIQVFRIRHIMMTYLKFHDREKDAAEMAGAEFRRLWDLIFTEKRTFWSEEWLDAFIDCIIVYEDIGDNDGLLDLCRWPVMNYMERVPKDQRVGQPEWLLLSAASWFEIASEGMRQQAVKDFYELDDAELDKLRQSRPKPKTWAEKLLAAMDKDGDYYMTQVENECMNVIVDRDTWNKGLNLLDNAEKIYLFLENDYPETALKRAELYVRMSRWYGDAELGRKWDSEVQEMMEYKLLGDAVEILRSYGGKMTEHALHRYLSLLEILNRHAKDDAVREQLILDRIRICTRLAEYNPQEAEEKIMELAEDLRKLYRAGSRK